ncbi:type VI secretion system Vgr family protein [Proteus mirabilis]|uniref:type VI secretion system Vgr family protein n=1 Tax=Proteus mirabilis TaxID=584 RepID=UPI0034D619DE
MLNSKHLFTVGQITNLFEPLLFYKLTGEEKLSDIYKFDVELLCPKNTIDLKEHLGKFLTIKIDDHRAPTRYLNGLITSMSLLGREESEKRYYLYRVTLSPTLWYLTQNKDCRIYQEKSVPEIVLSIFNEYQINVDNRLTHNYRIWNYCVQYQESDYDFICRLMEHEGIYFYFSHHANGHTLVLSDSPQQHDPLEGYSKIVYRQVEGGLTENDASIYQWNISDIITPSLYSMDDYDFKKPRANLLENCRNPFSYAKEKSEIFDWPGVYTEQSHGQFYTSIRQQEFVANHELIKGRASSIGIAPGCRFLLDNAPRPIDAREYMVISASYFFKENSYSSNDHDTAEHYIDFIVLPADTQWRPKKSTPWPKTHGPQTAEVVGPKNEKIWTDSYGRVKLKFRWDRYSESNETSSCWVRVSSNWAGWQYGGVQIPRIGEEVIVDFINGDPDRPIIIGRVYNEENMPPWDLPGNATRMGIMTRSKDGNIANANSLFMDDAQGNESFTMHAEKDMDISVENDFKLLVEGTSNAVVNLDAVEMYNANHAKVVVQTDVEAALRKVFAAGLRVEAVGADIKVRGMHIDSTQFEARVVPVYLGVTAAKILSDDTILHLFKNKIELGVLELNAKLLVLYL